MTTPPWTADIDVDVRLAAKLVRSQFPTLECASIVPFGHGWDNAAYLVDGTIVFRFPRRRIAAGLIAREAAILPIIGPHLSLPIPSPSFVGAKTEAYPWTFAGYELLAGTTACSRILSLEERHRLAWPLGRFLRSLHDIDVSRAVDAGLPPDELGRFDFERRLHMTRERLPILAGAGIVGAEDALAWMEAHPPAPVADERRTIVHGDLYARHLLVSATNVVCGIIDWGDVHLGDPALDLSIAYLVLPRSAHAAFREAYGGVDDRTWSAARFRATYHAVLELEYGIRVGDRGMQTSGDIALSQILARSSQT